MVHINGGDRSALIAVEIDLITKTSVGAHKLEGGAAVKTMKLFLRHSSVIGVGANVDNGVLAVNLPLRSTAFGEP